MERLKGTISLPNGTSEKTTGEPGLEGNPGGEDWEDSGGNPV